MGTSWRWGLDKEERYLVDNVFRIEGNNAPEVLRQYKKNNINTKGNSMCRICLKYDDRTFPRVLWMCAKCARKISAKGIITMADVKNIKITPRSACDWCYNDVNYKFVKIQLRLCLGCGRKYAKRSKDWEGANEPKKNRLRKKKYGRYNR